MALRYNAFLQILVKGSAAVIARLTHRLWLFVSMHCPMHLRRWSLQTEDWPAALKMLQEGSVEDFEVSFVNRGGVRGVLAGIEGFMPFSKMCTGLSGVNAAQQYKSLMSTLPGLNLRVKVVSVGYCP